MCVCVRKKHYEYKEKVEYPHTQAKVLYVLTLTRAHLAGELGLHCVRLSQQLLLSFL